ncbi:MAG: tetratricopeptide repeat protein [Gammaproteobacteria bacterium]
MARKEFNGALIGLLSVIILPGCSQLASHMGSLKAEKNITTPLQKASLCEEDNPDQNVKLDLIRRLMDSGKLYAALAHLDANHMDSFQSAYLRAEILRQTDRTAEAELLYRKLLDGCLAGKGYHGLGLIAGRNKKITEAIVLLQKAVVELPLDVRLRNDLGYALFLDRQFGLASKEFLTALELDGGDVHAATNMVLLLMATGKEQEMQAFVSNMNIDANTVAKLREQAKEIKASTSP